MWKTGSAKCFSQTMEKVPFRFRLWKTENGKRNREKNGFANSQITLFIFFYRKSRMGVSKLTQFIKFSFLQNTQSLKENGLP